MPHIELSVVGDFQGEGLDVFYGPQLLMHLSASVTAQTPRDMLSGCSKLCAQACASGYRIPALVGHHCPPYQAARTPRCPL